MHPVKLGFNECKLTHVLESVVERETQTSNISLTHNLKDSSNLPLTKVDKDSVTLFDLCQEFRDSESSKSIIIVKDTLPEEISNLSKEPPIDSAGSNINRYCTDVIKPYLKSYLYIQQCPDSEEHVLRDFIHSVDQEYPDYQPCFEACEGNKEVCDKIEERNTYSETNSVTQIDAVTSYNSIMESKESIPKDKNFTSGTQDPKCDKEIPDKHNDKPEISKTNVTSKCVEKNIEQPPEEDKPAPKPDCPPLAATRKESKISENESKSKESLCEYFGITNSTSRDKTPSQVTEPLKTETTNVDANTKTMAEAHSETLVTIKVAMEDFIAKAYKTTQEAVNVIKTESVKQFETFRKSIANSTEENVKPKSTCDNKTAEGITGFSFLRRIESKDKKDDLTDDQGTTGNINTGEILERIVGKVDSTISTISDNITFDNIADMLKPTKFKDPSSPYDIPTPPKEISHVITHESAQTSNSVFVAIKNRIYSMFSESDDKPKEVTEGNSLNSPMLPTREDSDEDLINKVIE